MENLFWVRKLVLHVAMNRSKHDGKSLLYIMEKSGQFSILNNNSYVANLYKKAYSDKIQEKAYEESLAIVNKPRGMTLRGVQLII